MLNLRRSAGKKILASWAFLERISTNQKLTPYPARQYDFYLITKIKNFLLAATPIPIIELPM